MLGGNGGHWDLGTLLQCGDTVFRVGGLGFRGQGLRHPNLLLKCFTSIYTCATMLKTRAVQVLGAR